jgi:PAS domain-containing protein
MAFFLSPARPASGAAAAASVVAKPTKRHECNQKRQRLIKGGTKTAPYLPNTSKGRRAMTSNQFQAATDGEPRAAEVLLPSVHPQVFQQTVNQADMAISITDGQGNILYVNPAFTRVTGYASEEAVGQNQSIVSHHSMPREFYQRSLADDFPWRTLEWAPRQSAQGRQQVPCRTEHLAGSQCQRRDPQLSRHASRHHRAPPPGIPGTESEGADRVGGRRRADGHRAARRRRPRRPRQP